MLIFVLFVVLCVVFLYVLWNVLVCSSGDWLCLVMVL